MDVNVNQSLEQAQRDHEKGYLKQQLKEHGFDLAATAAAAEISLDLLLQLIRRHGISVPELQEDPFYLDERWHRYPFSTLRRLTCEAFEAAYLRRLLRMKPESLSAAARLAQIDRKQLRGLLQRHGVKL